MTLEDMFLKVIENRHYRPSPTQDPRAKFAIYLYVEKDGKIVSSWSIGTKVRYTQDEADAEARQISSETGIVLVEERTK